MPFTPFHFGAHACVAFPLNKKVDIPVFILANVLIDIEPLLVMVFNLSYQLHGYAHTFIGATIVGVIWGTVAFKYKNILRNLMNYFKLPYETNFKKCIISGILGAWLHILFDSMIYVDIRPFLPFKFNPIYGLMSIPTLYILCSVLFIPASFLYVRAVKKFKNDIINKSL